MEILKSWKWYNVALHAFVLNSPWTDTGNDSVDEMLSALKWPPLQACLVNT